MSTSSINRRLLWKETRQVIPLALSLVGIAFLIVLCLRLLVNYQLSDFLIFIQVMFAMPPILFAVGAGSALVSAEKESRSLNWLVSLPVPTTYLVRHQFMVGLLGLIVLWLGCLVIYVLTGYFYVNHRDFYELGLVQFFVVLNSLYLLVCGFTTAWLARASILGLLSILVLAVLPYLAAFGIHYAFVELFTPGIHYHLDPSAWLIGAMLMLFIVCIGWIGFRSANRQLSGQANAAPSMRQQSLHTSLGSFANSIQDFFRGDSRTKAAPPSANSSLLWQFRNQNRGIVYGLYATFVLCMPFALSALQGRYNHQVVGTILTATCLVIAFCTLSWTALLAFHGDHIQDRIRFLAVHGVSPTRVWLTRHVVPLIFLVFYASVWCAFRDRLVMSYSQLIIGCGILYAVSQWASQLIRPAAIAALVAPLISTFAAFFIAGFVLVELETPSCVIVIALVIVPLFATWWMMPRWMDGRRGWRYWLTHFGLASIAVLMPVSSLLVWFVLAPPGFSSDERSRLRSAASDIAASKIAPIVPFPSPFVDFEPAKPRNTIELEQADLTKQRRIRLETLADAIRESGDYRTLWIELWSLKTVISDADLLRIALAYGDQDDQARDETLREYRETLRTLSQLVPALRKSFFLSQQESTDLLEIWLLAQVTKPESRKLLDGATYAEIVRNISQTEQRWEARRRALVASLSDYLESSSYNPPPEQLNTITIRKKPVGEQSLVDRLTSRRKFEHAMKSLLDYVDDAKAGRDEFPRQQLLELGYASPGAYGLGAAGPYVRIDDVSKFSLGTTINGALAAQWGAGWEKTASELASTLPQPTITESAK